MNLISFARLRRLVPAGAVAAVIAFSYLAPLPTEASKLNNCGVKAGYGYAFHDHGKPCPNRPFPGKGNGIANFPAVNTGTGSTGTSGAIVLGKSHNSKKDNDSLSSAVSSQSTDGHGHGKALGHSKGHGRQF